MVLRVVQNSRVKVHIKLRNYKAYEGDGKNEGIKNKVERKVIYKIRKSIKVMII